MCKFTNRLNDGYIGCGIRSEAYLRAQTKEIPFFKAVRKYGYHNFKREILCFFDTAEEAYAEEAFLVDEKWVKDPNNYNVSLGGKGGKSIKKHKHKYNDICNDFLKGMLVKDLEIKYGCCNAIIAEALKNIDKKDRDWERVFLDKYQSYLEVIKNRVINCDSIASIQRDLHLDYKTIKRIISICKIKPVYNEIIAIKGEIKEYCNSKTLTNFCRENNLNRSDVTDCLKGKGNSCKGWRFFFKKDYDSKNYKIELGRLDKYRDVEILTPEGNIVKIDTNVADFCRRYNLIHQALLPVIQRKRKHHKNYKLWQGTH